MKKVTASAILVSSANQVLLTSNPENDPQNQWVLISGDATGKNPEEVLANVLLKELGYCPPSLQFFKEYKREDSVQTVFVVPETVVPEWIIPQNGKELIFVPPKGLSSFRARRDGEIFLDYLRNQGPGE